jgi:hypothetical protein
MGQFSPDLTITGSAQTNLSSPVYTWVADLPPDAASKQWAVSALAGTQTGVRVHTAGDPFTLAIRRGRYNSLPAKNPVNGSYPNVPMNRIEILSRKGVYIDSANTVRVANLRLIAELPAGCEQFDAPNIRALCSNLFGVIAEESSDLGDTYVSGLISA